MPGGATRRDIYPRLRDRGPGAIEQCAEGPIRLGELAIYRYPSPRGGRPTVHHRVVAAPEPSGGSTGTSLSVSRY